MIDPTHDPTLRSWVESANRPGSDFPIQNLPFATCRRPDDEAPFVATAIGDQVLDVSEAFGMESMDLLMAMPRERRAALRRQISDFLAKQKPGRESFLTPIDDVEFLLPCTIGDYTDFYASIHHATNVGRMFRPDHPLLPNYRWMPVGYHGRASSVVVSGTPVRRPWGQTVEDPAGPPLYRPTRRLDYELEVGLFVGPGNPMGGPIAADQAAEHMVGVCLLNDWSARDIQSWEYQPLGPFLAKSFATSISPWVVTMEALEPFRTAGDPRPDSDPQPLPHLVRGAADAFDIHLEVWLQSARMEQPVRVSQSNFATMYWTFAQMIAHHTSNGCPLRPGDLIGSGTVSGPEKGNRGCLLEMTWRGTEPLELPTGEMRQFLEDGDEVTFRGWCEAPGFRPIGLGECRGRVVSSSSAT